jgi:hypothetical protein
VNFLKILPRKIALQRDAVLKRGADYVAFILVCGARDGFEAMRFEMEYEGYVYRNAASDRRSYGSMLVPREGLLR